MISNGESRTLELKKTTGELKDAMHTACAFLNTEGGWLVFKRNLPILDGIDVGNNVGNNVGNKEKIILDIIRNTPSVTTPQIADKLGVTQRHCERILSEMKKQRIIRRVGTKGGHWEIIEGDNE